MRDLHEMNFGQRFMLTIVICLVILFALALFGYLTGGWDTDVQAQSLPSRCEGRMIELDKQALDQAYVTQAAHVFGIWIKDGVGDASRARIGFGNARKGYDAAMAAIAVREQRQREQP
jgi:hypothetical protein